MAALRDHVLWSNPDLRRSFLGNLTSNLGSAISGLAFPLLVLSLGGSAVQAGLVATVSLVTRLGFRLPAGALVDRWNRRVVMMATDLVRCATLASIPLAALWSTPQYWQLLLVAVVEGLASALFGPANSVLTRDVVSEEQLSQALGADQAMLNTVSLAGPALGGVLFAVDRMLPFAVDAVSYAASALLILRITVRPAAAPGAAEPTEPAERGATAGLRWLAAHRELLVVLFYAAVVNLVAAAVDVVVILELRERGASGTVIGAVIACIGAGGIVGALFAPWLVRRLSIPAMVLAIGVIWTAELAVFTVAFQPVLVGALLAVMMLLSPAAGVAVFQALLGKTPRHLVGRVSAATSLLLNGLAALGPVAAGAAYQAIGGTRTWLVLALLTGAATLGGWLALTATRARAVADSAVLAHAEGDRP
ncbi:MFS transporter [Kitasatospora sp. NBC_01250]|uniref:MFS transporter n=1 Tax=Kitasatospora sp. NBC_01250 TaxID=2903571 RepID=UPI002E324F90|nr:MFS transporter [Kitasatospora sp. NBC_01250]